LFAGRGTVAHGATRIPRFVASVSTCAICQLHHPELLEAAHIVPDRDPHGEPTVTNGVSLCVLRHTAFDRHIVGIRPDYRIEIRTDILEETDGPMLKHGLQGFQDELIHRPHRAGLRLPAPGRRLARRLVLLLRTLSNSGRGRPEEPLAGRRERFG
jgi:hypothetical protein